ncbi:MAG: DNA polymerase I [Nitrospirota bacterium]|nr:DNA polymerase I [Nitrospirota bacterium]
MNPFAPPPQPAAAPEPAAAPRPSLYLLDASAQIYRAFFALRGFTTRAGLPTNAVYGFITILNKLRAEHQPDALIACFDAPGRNFRHERYADYKSTRQKMPDELVVQLPYIRRLVAAMNIPVAELSGFEADDLIGTLARRAEAVGYQVTIVSGDKDMMQLVNPAVRLYDAMKDKYSGAPEVLEKFGVEPQRVIDVMGLMGDTSDNVPGIPGVGEVTAKKLIEQFHTLEGVLAGVEQIKAKGVQAKVREHAELARLSRQLVTIDTDVPLELDFTRAHVGEPDAEALTALYRELEFTSLLGTVAAPTASAASAGKDYRTVTEPRRLAHIAARATTLGEVSVDLETTGLDPLQADVVGIALSLAPGEGFYVPVAHAGDGGQHGDSGQMDRQTALDILRPLLESDTVAKVGQNLKYDLNVLRRAGVTLRGVRFDTMLAAYLLAPNRRSHGLDNLALEYLNHRTIPYEEVTGKGARQIPFAEVAVDVATRYAAEDAEIALCLKQTLAPQLKDNGLEELFYDLEMPLLPVLARMEATGFLVDIPWLAAISRDMGEQITALERDIHALAGEEFNVASPKQLQVILFEKLGLKPVKKTKTGLSTDEEVLAKLASEHPLPAKILALRQFAKLKSTYVDALPQMVNPDTGRVHTSLNQTVAATGRLSSSEPNLQNIPVRTDEGKKIRRAFICPPGCKLVSADYSQIELRVLAHMAEDAALIEAFHAGGDIHRRTAAGVFGIHEGLVTDQMRREAKAINFGLIYGMGAFSLAQDVGVSQKEARGMIERYFATYSGVKAWIERTQAEATRNGMVTTLYGRRRAIPELASANAQIRAAGERTATNTVIQGTAADIIKRAMLAVDQRLTDGAISAKMLLQVHDELIFEVDQRAVDPLIHMVRREMEQAATLAVPLVVDVGVGDNWEEAH